MLAADPNEIRRFLDYVLAPGQVTELRAPAATPRGTREVTLFGYFDDRDTLVRSAVQASQYAPAVYILPNPVSPDLLARAANRVKEHGKKDSETGDRDILARRWLLVDCDPVRPGGISSSDAEHAASLDRVRTIRDALAADGWPAPILADSGNGGHLMYRVDLPAQDGELVDRCLHALAARFDDAVVKVDTGVDNPARIWKLYGTPARKGDSTPARPHRLARLLDAPARLDIVPPELLDALAGTLPPDPPKSGAATAKPTGGIVIPWFDGFDLAAWIAKHLPDAKGPKPWNGGKRWVLPACPWDSNHKASAYVVRLASGAIGAGCHHNSCQTKGWHDLRDAVEPGWRTRQQYAPAKGQTAAPEPWEEPVPLGIVNTPDAFPVDALPGWLGDFAGALSVATQTAPDLAGCLSLAAVAASVQKRAVIVPAEGWTEPANVYTSVALASGNRKSAALAAATRPLEAFERSESERLAGEVALAEADLKQKRARLESLQATAARSKDDAERQQAAEDARLLAVELAGAKPPSLPRYLVDDCTPERLATLLTLHGGRMAVFAAEGDVFDLMRGRYSDGTANFGVFLRGHAGDPLRIDRVNRPAEYVAAPALTLGLAVQPDVLRGLAAEKSLRGRGLLARFLYSWPTSTLGNRDVDAPAVPETVEQAYHVGIERLLRMPPATAPDGSDAPHVVRLSSEAATLFRDFRVWLEPQLAESAALGCIADWSSKLPGAVARLALGLHLAAHAHDAQPWAQPVAGETMAGALKLGRYFLSHARFTFAAMGADPAVEAARYVLAWIVRNVASSFTRREALRGCAGRIETVDELAKSLDVLESHGYIRERPGPENRRRGSPSVGFDANPRTLDHSATVSKQPSFVSTVSATETPESGAPAAEEENAATPEPTTATRGTNAMPQAVGSQAEPDWITALFEDAAESDLEQVEAA